MTVMKKIIVWGLVGVILLWGTVLAQAEEPEFDLKSQSAVLMNGATGEVLYKKQAQQKLPPASITKIMTMLLTVEAIEEGRVELDDKIMVSEHAAEMGGSQIWLEPGEEMTLEELLKAVAVVSANDACVAIAEYIYGTEAEFVEEMNKKAQELGMKNTKFYNTNGLPVGEEGKENYTTAYDVALMSRALLQYPLILEYTSIWTDHLRDGESFLRNTNDLVRFYEGVDGLKTGYTSEAGFCLSATAKQEGMRFISVIMNAPGSDVRFAETKKLLSYAFNIHRSILVVEKGEEIGEVKVFKGKQEKVAAVAKDDLQMTVKKGEENNLVKQSRLVEDISAPVKAGQEVGKVVALRGEEEVASVKVVAKSEVEKANFIEVIVQLFKRFLNRLLNVFG